MSKENGHTTIQPGSKIDAIKEIIFGQTMQEYDERFSTLEILLKNKLKEQKKDSDARVRELKKEFNEYKAEMEQKLQRLEKGIMKQIDAMEQSKVDKKIIKKHLINLVENL